MTTTKLNETWYAKEIRGYVFNRPSFLNIEEREKVDGEDLYFLYLRNVDKFYQKVKELAKLFANNRRQKS